jgi:hypothetical protein
LLFDLCYLAQGFHPPVDGYSSPPLYHLSIICSLDRFDDVMSYSKGEAEGCAGLETYHPSVSPKRKHNMALLMRCDRILRESTHFVAFS